MDHYLESVRRNLIIDVGMHKGEDTMYYLSLGYHVVAIDADPTLVETVALQLKDYISNGQLNILNFAVSDCDNELVDFNLSNNTMWSSLNPKISDRNSNLKEIIKIQTRKLSTIIDEFGTPFYCKIDVEGFDLVCIRTLATLKLLPHYISVETECGEEDEIISAEKAAYTLEALHDLGYKKFKLVDQQSLSILQLDKPFYKRGKDNGEHLTAWHLLSNKFGLKRLPMTTHEILCKTHNYNFPAGASGPFGTDLAGSWYDYEAAKKLLNYHRSQFFEDQSKLCFSFWCDWHATF
jgi:FkbM family methyltransferase